MKNADKPINPAFTVKSQEGNQVLATPEAANRGMINYANIGLTKREYFAAMAMQGLADKFLVKKAILIADTLLEELEKSETDE